MTARLGLKVLNNIWAPAWYRGVEMEMTARLGLKDFFFNLVQTTDRVVEMEMTARLGLKAGRMRFCLQFSVVEMEMTARLGLKVGLVSHSHHLLLVRSKWR